MLVQGCSQVLETSHLIQLLAVHADICTDVVRAVGHDSVLFCTDFHSTCRCSVYESVGEVLRFNIPSSYKIDDVCKS